jgi:hypothetical protein
MFLSVRPTGTETAGSLRTATTINSSVTDLAVFAQGNGNVPFDPAVNRIFVLSKTTPM